ncbi:MAG: GIY-YIG nuclease family protein [Alphaproteobacteria bacterium]
MMTKNSSNAGRLSEVQLDFLQRHRINPGDVFNATGMRTCDYSEEMKVVGKHFAFGVTPCAAAGHTLRSRAGHCIQCDTAKIAFSRRHAQSGTIYLAGSIEAGLLKIGVTQDISERVDLLRAQKYGGASDWDILVHAMADMAGQVEFLAQDRLRKYQVTGSYFKNGREQACYELFRCSFDIAKVALVGALPPGAKVCSAISASEARRTYSFGGRRSDTLSRTR